MQNPKLQILLLSLHSSTICLKGVIFWSNNLCFFTGFQNLSQPVLRLTDQWSLVIVKERRSRSLGIQNLVSTRSLNVIWLNHKLQSFRHAKIDRSENNWCRQIRHKRWWQSRKKDLMGPIHTNECLLIQPEKGMKSTGPVRNRGECPLTLPN